MGGWCCMSSISVVDERSVEAGHQAVATVEGEVHEAKKGSLSVSVKASSSAFYVLRKTNDVLERYVVQEEELGSGQFGVVSVVVEKTTGKKYAMKSMSKRRADVAANQGADIRTEVEVLYHLGGHANVVQLHEVYEDNNAIHLIMELCEGGDWFQRLSSGGTYSERSAAEAMRTLLQGSGQSLGDAHAAAGAR
ncbi:hypothetical protein FOA52_014831 [Chlamydomonas sp. UWO 241]|nr:hypothetical protein FOA52_014831 [Chlamydomonas sp. UWO 241]